MRRVLLPLLLLSFATPLAAAEPIEGRWLTEGSRALITVSPDLISVTRLMRVSLRVSRRCSTTGSSTNAGPGSSTTPAGR